MCKAGGVLLCTVPTLVAVLECLPTWTKEGGALSGLFAVLLILAAAPLYRLSDGAWEGSPFGPFGCLPSFCFLPCGR